MFAIKKVISKNTSFIFYLQRSKTSLKHQPHQNRRRTAYRRARDTAPIGPEAPALWCGSASAEYKSTRAPPTIHR